MASLNLSAKLFYRDNGVIIHSLMDQQIGRFFLAIPTAQYSNFLIFTRMVKEDNARKGTSEYSNETMKRKEFLEDVIKSNELIKNLNTNLVFSRVNHLKELPVNELMDVLDDNKPFDMEKYKIIAKKIEDLINENFRLMTSSNIKNNSIEQTIFLISQTEKDKEFIKYLKENLSKENNHKDIELLRKDYEAQKIKLDISDYKEIINNDKKIIIGLNSSNEMFSVVIPNQYNMLEVFKMELETIDKTRFIGLTEKQTARLIFDKIILDLPSQRMVEKEEKKDINLDNQILNQALDKKDNNYLIDNNNNIAINQENKEEVIAIEKNENGEIKDINNLQTQTYNYNSETNLPTETPTISQSQGKKRILRPSNKIPDNNSGFIKIGTIVLFGLSFILTIISLILLIMS